MLADLHDKAWVSMQQTYVKNQSLVEEWEEEREGIKDGINTALDRCAGAYVCVSLYVYIFVFVCVCVCVYLCICL